MRLKSGEWVGGIFATRRDGRESYSSGYPEEPGDLYLSQVVEIDADTGQWILDERGKAKMTGTSLLLRWDEVEILDLDEGSGRTE